jgi:hypothetical protein
MRQVLLKKNIISVVLLFALSVLFIPSVVLAANPCKGKKGAELTTCKETAAYKSYVKSENKIGGDDGVDEGVKAGESGNTNSLPDIIGTVINVALFIVGTLSVIMLIYGGIKYTTSAGDTAKVTSAKNTIMYSIVGLVVAILAYAIVQFVVVNLKK